MGALAQAAIDGVMPAAEGAGSVQRRVQPGITTAASRPVSTDAAVRVAPFTFRTDHECDDLRCSAS